MRRDDGASRLASRRASRVALALFACAALVSVVSGGTHRVVAVDVRVGTDDPRGVGRLGVDAPRDVRG